MSISRRAFAASLAVVPLTQGKPQSAISASVPALSEWQAQVFDDHQLETVAVLAELIIPATDTPGARDALVHRHLDHILAESPDSVRNKFLEGLWWLDGYCLQHASKPFREVSPPEQTKILLNLFNSSELDLQTGTEFVQLAKNWTARIYYSTRIGEQELNKGGRVPASYIRACSA
jgi:gluconate 2-dehydrogenase gamma chain